MATENTWTRVLSALRILLVIAVPAAMIYTIIIMLLPSSVTVNSGKADLAGVDFSQNKLVMLNGPWEFYWDKLLAPEDLASNTAPQPDSYMSVPGVWSANAGTTYPRQGMTTYRLTLDYPADLADPALRVQNVANAYRLYINGHLAAEAGSGLDSRSAFVSDDDILLIPLPTDIRHVELVFQVANWNCATGGLRVAPVFGSLQVLEQQRTLLLILQMFFIGGVFIFGLHYLFLYFLQTKNKAALLFAVFCLMSALRSLVWGETPLTTIFPQASLHLRMYLNYLTGYNFVALILLFVRSIFPSEYPQIMTRLILLPSLIFDALLLIAGPEFMTFLTNCLYVVLLLQMLYLLGVQIKAVLRGRDNGILMFLAVSVLIWAMNTDILSFLVTGNIYFTCMFLLGNFAFILAMSYIQARQQAVNHKKLLAYNEHLLESDRLKDRIMATEMSFLQAQIKPHFLYNALSAIANVCEKDGKEAGRLIIDLAVYLRGSLEFNHLDKMVTVEKEMSFVETYFRIEQARFGSKIRLEKEIEIPLDTQIPVLVLQPLVENGVRHGISKKPEGGTVTVRMTRREGLIVLEIADDGVGLDGVKAAAILNGEDASQGVGLLNIHSRLLKLYGLGLDISGVPGGTRVTITIPEVI